MAKYVLQSTVLSTNGGVSVAPGAQVTVRNHSGLLVPLWSDRGGTQPISNPFTTDSSGFFRVYADAGRYRVTASKDGQSQEWRDVLLGGVIVEQGENANGSYWRWEGGLQVCVTDGLTLMYSSSTVLMGSWSLPAVFSGGDYIVSPLMMNVSLTSGKRRGLLDISIRSPSYAQIRLVGEGLFTDGDQAGFMAVAVGRWK